MKQGQMDPDDVIAAYDRNGRVWAASRDRRLTERPWLDRALALAPREAGKRRVLDLGCGAGRPLAEYLVDRGCLVTGVDASRPMIELFARVVPAATALHADMRGLRLNAVFDLILAWDSQQVKLLKQKGNLDIPGVTPSIAWDDVEIKVESKKGYAYKEEGQDAVALETGLTAELEAEGLARELVHLVQNLRKNSGLEVSDRIEIIYGAEADLSQAMERHREWIMNEVLATSMEPGAGGPSAVATEVNGRKLIISINKTKGAAG